MRDSFDSVSIEVDRREKRPAEVLMMVPGSLPIFQYTFLLKALRLVPLL